MKKAKRVLLLILTTALFIFILFAVLSFLCSAAYWIKADNIPSSVTITNLTDTVIDKVTVKCRHRLIADVRIAPYDATNLLFAPSDDTCYNVVARRNALQITTNVGYLTVAIVADDTICVGRDVIIFLPSTNILFRPSLLSLFY